VEGCGQTKAQGQLIALMPAVSDSSCHGEKVVDTDGSQGMGVTVLPQC
jgi:hypothetical protein